MAASNAEDIRVVTTIGHVDHGKTTFVDYLLAANSIISSRSAGKMRYMDSREDEQERGITMESSAVSLQFKVLERKPEGASVPRTYVINLIDTPGHVDFSGEVSSASRLCDGALLLVDAVEGVCTQTITVLRQAWIDRVRPILVINKMDRLITELKLSPIEGYHHLVRLIEQVNAVIGSFFAGERMEEDLRWREEREQRIQSRKDAQDATNNDAALDDSLESEFKEKDDESLYFAPEHGNVIFASALDGWGFRIGKFAQLYSQKLGMKEATLRQVLWGDYYLDPKTKMVIGHKHLRGRNLKPLFVQFVLENIWAVYDSVILNPNPDKTQKIVSTLNLKVLPRDLKSKDTRHLNSLIFGQWLPLSTCTIQAIVDVIPPPSLAQHSKLAKILHPDVTDAANPVSKLEKDLFFCSSTPDACVVVYISKMFAVRTKDLPGEKPKPLTAEEMRRRGRQAREQLAKESTLEDSSSATNGEAPRGDPVSSNEPQPEPQPEPESAPEPEQPPAQDEETLLGFARIFSGSLQVGRQVYYVLPKYNNSLPPTHPRNAPHVATVKIKALYTMMGRDLIPVDIVHAGNVFAVQGLEGKVWRTATLCSPQAVGTDEEGDLEQDKESIVNMGAVTMQTSPIVRIALEPKKPANLPKLVQGLKLLNQADPCVRTFQQQTGEHVILTAGELHFERCLKDLRERFAKIDIQTSKPIIPFRETAVKAADMALPKTSNAPRGMIHGSSAFSLVNFTIRAALVPADILKFMKDNTSVLKRLRREMSDLEAEKEDEREAEQEDANLYGEVVRKATIRPEEFWETLAGLCKKAGAEWKDLPDRLWDVGPRGSGDCMLIDARDSEEPNSLKHLTRQAAPSDKARLLQDFENCVETGFQIATLRGPLCAEPVEGLAYFVEKLNFDQEAADAEQAQGRMAQVTGSLITAVQEACRSGLLDWSPRLMLAMYSCDIQAATDVLGKVYGVVAKRRGRITAEEMKEGTSFFTVKALLPVVESFGFAAEIRKRTSGAASPQLIFAGYEMLDQDPFWVPTTEEELEDLGDKADRANLAKTYMDRVRQRKGLFVDRKIVESAEKQRTLKR